MVSTYQEKVADQDGFFIKDGFLVLSEGDSISEKKLREDDENLSLDFILRSFRALDYFPKKEFAIGSPVSLNLSIAIDYSLDQTVSGICDIDSPDYMRSSNVWEAEWTKSNLFEAAEKIPSKARTYLPKDADPGLEGWIFSAPFLYSGIFVKDTVLRKRVLLSIEAVLYRIENKTVSKLPHKTSVDNIFSLENKPWQFNIPVLGA